MTHQTIVFVHYRDDDTPVYYVQGDVDVIVVDERCPNDRVYKMTRYPAPEQFLKSLEGEYFGHADDARQKKLEADIAGTSHLKEV
jgi:hypothetical protein